jgi:hypothetical protein
MPTETSAMLDEKIETELGAECFVTLSRADRFQAMADHLRETGRDLEAERWAKLADVVAVEVQFTMPDNGRRGDAKPVPHRPGEAVLHITDNAGMHVSCSVRCSSVGYRSWGKPSA